MSVVVFCTSTSAELKAKGGFITAAKAGSNQHGQVKNPLPSPLYLIFYLHGMMGYIVF
jgi:hypothetical protein